MSLAVISPHNHDGRIALVGLAQHLDGEGRPAVAATGRGANTVRAPDARQSDVGVLRVLKDQKALEACFPVHFTARHSGPYSREAGIIAALRGVTAE
jgi:hypothetical protein